MTFCLAKRASGWHSSVQDASGVQDGVLEPFWDALQWAFCVLASHRLDLPSSGLGPPKPDSPPSQQVALFPCYPFEGAMSCHSRLLITMAFCFSQGSCNKFAFLIFIAKRQTGRLSKWPLLFFIYKPVGIGGECKICGGPHDVGLVVE